MNPRVLSVGMILALAGAASALDVRGPACQVSIEHGRTVASPSGGGTLDVGSCVDPLATNDACFAADVHLSLSSSLPWDCQEPILDYCLDVDRNGICDASACRGLLACHAVDVEIGGSVETGLAPTSAVLHCEAYQLTDENGTSVGGTFLRPPRMSLLLAASDPESFMDEVAECEAGRPYRAGYDGVAVGMDPELGF